MSVNTLIYKGCFLIILVSLYGCGASQNAHSLSQIRGPLTVNSQGAGKTRVGGALIRFASSSNRKFAKPYTLESIKSSSSIQYLQKFYQDVRSDLSPFTFLLSKKAKSRCKLNTKSDQILTAALAQTLKELKAQVYKVNQTQHQKGRVAQRPSTYMIEGQGNMWTCKRKKKRQLIFEVHTSIKKEGSKQTLDLQMDLRLNPKDFEGSTRKTRDRQAKQQGLTQITYQIADDLYRCFDQAPVDSALAIGIDMSPFTTHKVECNKAP